MGNDQPKKWLVASDLHLHDEPQPFGFTEAKEEIFVSVVESTLASGAGILLAGDIFDLTGMLPPQKGLPEFFVELLGKSALDDPKLMKATEVRTIKARVMALRDRFPRFFRTLSRTAAQDQLTFLPGNHDCELSSPEGQEALASAFDSSRTGLHAPGEFHIGDFVIAAHGHEYDPPNRTGRTCFNPGAALTSALYHGIVPVLPYFGMPGEAVSAIPAVRPEEAVVEGILHYLGRERGKKLVVALVRLLDRAGYFRGLPRVGMSLLNHPIPWISGLAEALVTPERLVKALPTDEDLKAIGRRGARALRKPGKVIVLGHTHVTDWDKGYVNLGTWIDHVEGLLPEQLANPDSTLPVLRIHDNRSAELWNAKKNEKLCQVEADAAGIR